MSKDEGSIFHTHVPRPTQTRNHLVLVGMMFSLALIIAVVYAEGQGDKNQLMTAQDKMILPMANQNSQ